MGSFAQERPENNKRFQKFAPREQIIAEWPLNKRETARVSICRWKRGWLINFSRWFEADNGEMRPCKGFGLSIKNLPKLTEALSQALVIANERGLISADDGDEQ